MNLTTIRQYAVAVALGGALVTAPLGAGAAAAAGPVHDARTPAAAAVLASVGANASPLTCAMDASALAGGLRERAFTAQSAKNFAVQTRQACEEVRQ